MKVSKLSISCLLIYEAMLNVKILRFDFSVKFLAEIFTNLVGVLTFDTSQTQFL